MGNEIMTRDMKSLENSSRIQGEFALNSKRIHAEILGNYGEIAINKTVF